MAEKGKLTPKQAKFVDEYVISGNATEAAKKAGYAGKTIRKTASENLTKPDIKEAIERRMKEIESQKIADGKEAMEGLSSIARQEKQPNGEIPTTAESFKAWQEIMKRHPLTDLSKAQIRKANAEARSAELDAEIKQAQLDSINSVADKTANKFDDWSSEDLKILIGKADDKIARSNN